MMPTQPKDRPPKKTGGSPSVPEPGVVLPPGYRIHLGVNLLVLRRADGSMVAAFSALGADPSEVEMETEKGYRRSGQGTAWPATRRGPLFPWAWFPRTGAKSRHNPPRRTGETSPTEICS